jgi:hypothetical protein
MAFRALQLIDKSSYPTYTPGPCLDIQEWQDEALNEGTGGLIPNNQLHTTYSDFTRKVHYHQDEDNISAGRETSHSENGPVPEKNNSLVVSFIVHWFDDPIRTTCHASTYLPADTIDMVLVQGYKPPPPLDIHNTPRSIPVTNTRSAAC